MEAKNYLIGGIVSRELLAKLAPLLALSSDFNYRSTKDNMSMFLLARGNHFMRACSFISYYKRTTRRRLFHNS